MGFIGHQVARRRCLGGHPPFIGQDHHGLGKVERIMLGVQRIAHQRIGARQILGFQPGAFRAEKHRHALAFGIDGAQILSRCPRIAYRHHHMAWSRAGGQYAVTIGERGIECIEDLRRMNDGISPGSRGQGIGLWPAIARRHDTQMEQAAIGHGAGGAADIARHLRAHQHDDRAFTRGRRQWRPPFRAPACHRARKALGAFSSQVSITWRLGKCDQTKNSECFLRLSVIARETL